MMRNAKLNKIPSVELQLLKWISLVDAGMIPACVDLKRGGTRIWIKRACHDLAGVGDDVSVLTLSNISLNRRLKVRGWFTEFLALCDALVPWPALYVEGVQNPRLPVFLRLQGFVELQHDNFYRPSLRWRTQHGWSPEDFRAAQSAAERAHVRSLFENPEDGQVHSRMEPAAALTAACNALCRAALRPPAGIGRRLAADVPTCAQCHCHTRASWVIGPVAACTDAPRPGQ